MKCAKCKKNDVASAYEICGPCKGAKATLQQQQLVERSKKNKDRTSVPGWLMTTEHEFATIDKRTLSSFNKNKSTVADDVLIAVEAHKNDKAASKLDDQYTVKDYGGTVTLDYQGTRAGGGKYWIDLQGQVGGGSTDRNTYFQIMIECCGQAPPKGLVEDAITTSNSEVSSKDKNKGVRTVLHLELTTARPNRKG